MTPRITIRRATSKHDLAAVRRIQRKLFEKTEIPPLANRYWWLAWHHDTPVAFAGLRFGEGYGFLALSGVLPKYRGHGIQKRLIDARLRLARRFKEKCVVTYTIHGNCPSANSLIARGFRLYVPKKLYAQVNAFYFYRFLGKQLSAADIPEDVTN